MSVNSGGQGSQFISELWQWRGIAFGQLPYTLGKRMRDTIEFALHGGGERGQPFVVDNERLDFVLGQLRVFARDLFRERVLRVREFVRCSGFLLDELKIIFKRFAFVRCIGVALNFLEPGGDAGLRDFAFVVGGVG